jgi:glycosyltransferase involved in cell wall biosynthesis
VPFADVVFVVDGGSTDGTTEIAEELRANVVRHAWSGYAAQKNWALDNLPIKTEWVLFLDADERLTSELAEEILAVVASPNARHAGYYVARRMIFLGRWLRHTYWYPDFNLRLFRVGSGRFEDRLVHERVVLDGTAGYLRNDLVHEDHRPIAAYVARLNRYSTLEAEEMSGLPGLDSRVRVASSFRGDWAARRRALKERVWYRLPFRAVVRFVWTMTIRRGFLDGRAGLIFTVLACGNEWLATAKLYEMRTRAREV